MNPNIKLETLILILTKVLDTDIIRADYQTKQLQGGTLGDVRLVTGMAETASNRKIPYKVVLKMQKKWERPGDPDSWRREYDLYASKFSRAFSDSFRLPECYHAEVNGNAIQIWMEYIDGISGGDLTIEMLEHAAEELGRFQGRLYKHPEILQNMPCLSETNFVEKEFSQWHTQTFTYEFLISEKCQLPGFIKQMLKDGKIQLYKGKSFEYGCLRSRGCDIPEHLKHMFIDIDERKEAIFNELKSLPIVLCHRDFWIENIFVSNGRIRLIDWDCTGWGYIGEDIASLIADDTEARYLDEYYRRLIPAYYRGLSECMDVLMTENHYIQEMIIIKFGYRILQKYMFSQSSDVKNEQITALQKIYEMRDINVQ
jgi:thiamine kinase-like enzyme